MATAKTKQQIEALKSAIAAHPKGASLDQILSYASPLGISRNTLIRRLNDMVSAGQLTKAVNRHPTLTPHRRAMLTPLQHELLRLQARSCGA